jgi:hypothetical protein
MQYPLAVFFLGLIFCCFAYPEESRNNHKSDFDPIQRHSAGVGFEISNMYYDEPEYMRNKGFMYGVYGDYTFRSNHFMFKLDGRFSLGNIDYWSSETGIVDGQRDYNFETRSSVGYDIRTASRKAIFTPFIGFGYRYLFDGLSASGYGGYDRTQHYLYTPLGMETMFPIGTNWKFGLTGEYDLFWQGWNYSDLKDSGLGLDRVLFYQRDGLGTRYSIKTIRRFGKIDFAMEPYFRYWNIDESDFGFGKKRTDVSGNPDYISIYYVEPHNTTTEWGLKVGAGF